ncbi:T-cell surface glycoprotein CD8 alpha chain, partial [Mesitornis unicolor]
SNITHPEMGQRLELECVTPLDYSNVFWFHQDKGGILHFIVFISFWSETTFEGYQKTSTYFEASKEDKFYRLVVKSFTSQDKGTYFCIMNSYQMLYFGPGQPAFFPVCSLGSTRAGHNTSCGHFSGPFLFSIPAETSEDKELNFCCDIFIWVLLALACLLLVIALAVTIMLCQR